jgi:hypothetical protein
MNNALYDFSVKNQQSLSYISENHSLYPLTNSKLQNFYEISRVRQEAHYSSPTLVTSSSGITS